MYIEKQIIIDHILSYDSLIIIFNLKYPTTTKYYSHIKNIIEYTYYGSNSQHYVGFITIKDYNIRLRKYKLNKLINI